MVEWWGDNGPPVYVSVAGYLGLIKKKSKSVLDGKSKETGNLEEIFKHFGQDGMLQ